MNVKGVLLTGMGSLLLVACGSDAKVEGAWDVTLTIQEDVPGGEPEMLAFLGTMTLKQTFDSFEGSGSVVHPESLECEIPFDIEGFAYNPESITMSIDLGSSDCGDGGLQDVSGIALNLLSEGMVLNGHKSFECSYGDGGESLCSTLYVAASAQLY